MTFFILLAAMLEAVRYVSLIRFRDLGHKVRFQCLHSGTEFGIRKYESSDVNCRQRKSPWLEELTFHLVRGKSIVCNGNDAVDLIELSNALHLRPL